VLAFDTASSVGHVPKQQTDWGAAGITLLAKDTGRLLALKRSFFWPQCKSGGTWCNAGGSRDKEDTCPLETALRETGEEILNFNAGILQTIHLAFIYCGRSGTRKPFHNFIGIIEEEFTPVLDHRENTESRWLHAQDWPRPLHFGMIAFFEDPGVQKKLQAPFTSVLSSAASRSCPRFQAA